MSTVKPKVSGVKNAGPKMPDVRNIVLGGLAISACGLGLSNVMRGPPAAPEFIRMKSEGRVVNVAHKNIRWFEQDGECFYVCTKKNGCLINTDFAHDKWAVCKSELPRSWVILDELIDE